MNSNKAIVDIYQTISPRLGSSTARQTLMGVLGKTLRDLEEDGVEVTEKALSERLARLAQEFANTSKRDAI